MSLIQSTKHTRTFGSSNYDLNTIYSYVRMPMSLTTLCTAETSYHMYSSIYGSIAYHPLRNQSMLL